MVYGPFNQVYGFGAVLLTVLLEPLAGKSGLALFLGSAVLGGLFEALCSLLQEKAYGTVSWEYSGRRFSLLNGRTDGGYMIFWGILGLFYIRMLQPWLFGIFNQIPLSIKLPTAILVAVFFTYNLWISNAAVRRWNQRLRGLPPSDSLDRWLDVAFSDSRMKKIYPSMMSAERHERSQHTTKVQKEDLNIKNRTSHRKTIQSESDLDRK